MSALRDVVRDVVIVAAPHELALFDAIEPLDDEQVTRVLTDPARRQDPLAFGVTEVAALVTPVVWLVVDEVARRGVGRAADGMFARLASALRRLFGRKGSTPPRRSVPLPLTPEQLEAVHARVLERAGAMDIDEGTAQILADAVVSRLARG